MVKLNQHIRYRLLVLVMIVAGVSLLPACQLESEPVFEVTPTLATFSQWATGAAASSFYGFPDWGVNRATGAPEVQACRDDSRAWASARGNGVEWLRLSYAKPVFATEVRIYQSFGRGAISRVSLIDEAGTAQQIWEGMDTPAPCPGTLTITVPRTTYRVTGILVDLDESRTGFWNQIDAVELVGIR